MSLERYLMKRRGADYLQFLCPIIMSYLRVRGITKYLTPLQRGLRKRTVVALVLAYMAYSSLLREASLSRHTVLFPSPGVRTLREADSRFDGVRGEELFFHRFRFRRADFQTMMLDFNLFDGTTYNMLSIRRSNRVRRYPSDLCLMLVLRRLSFPCRYFDLVDEFGLPSNRLCDIFKGTLQWLYETYAQRLTDFRIWVPFFREFARAMSDMGSPYDNHIALTNGTFMGISRPGGLGNWLTNAQFNQADFYSGHHHGHGISFLAALFPNGMTSLYGPLIGSTNDQRAIRLSEWLTVLGDLEQQTGEHYVIFGDSGFFPSRYIHTMVKSPLSRREKRYNAHMSRIRIAVENSFAGLDSVFNFMSYAMKHQVGKTDPGQAYVVANFLMNVRSTFYGNQFSHALQYPLRLSLHDYLAL